MIVAGLIDKYGHVPYGLVRTAVGLSSDSFHAWFQDTYTRRNNVREFFPDKYVRDMRDALSKEQRDWVRRERLLPMFMVRTIRDAVIRSFAHVNENTMIGDRKFHELGPVARIELRELFVELAVKSVRHKMVEIA